MTEINYKEKKIEINREADTLNTHIANLSSINMSKCNNVVVDGELIAQKISSVIEYLREKLIPLLRNF